MMHKSTFWWLFGVIIVIITGICLYSSVYDKIAIAAAVEVVPESTSVTVNRSFPVDAVSSMFSDMFSEKSPQHEGSKETPAVISSSTVAYSARVTVYLACCDETSQEISSVERSVVVNSDNPMELMKVAVEALLKGPTREEASLGFWSAIPADTKLSSISKDDEGEIYITFNNNIVDELNAESAQNIFLVEEQIRQTVLAQIQVNILTTNGQPILQEP
jgi:spore germination protein GerM